MTWTAAFEIVNPGTRSPLVILCDHASNAIPPELGDLGVPAAERRRHIAWDIGAAGIARLLAARFDAPAILCGTSRLVIDCNRQLAVPTLIPAVSDGTTIPGNAALGPEERERRIARYFRPYHDACAAVIDAALAVGRRPCILSVHSMTHTMNGTFRPWQISLSTGSHRSFADPVLAALRREPSITVGDNEPYALELATDYSTPVHALARGLDYIQVEFRQDEVADDAGERRYARIFADAIAGVIGQGSEP